MNTNMNIKGILTKEEKLLFLKYLKYAPSSNVFETEGWAFQIYSDDKSRIFYTGLALEGVVKYRDNQFSFVYRIGKPRNDMWVCTYKQKNFIMSLANSAINRINEEGRIRKAAYDDIINNIMDYAVEFMKSGDIKKGFFKHQTTRIELASRLKNYKDKITQTTGDIKMVRPAEPKIEETKEVKVNVMALAHEIRRELKLEGHYHAQMKMALKLAYEKIKGVPAKVTNEPKEEHKEETRKEVKIQPDDTLITVISPGIIKVRSKGIEKMFKVNADNIRDTEAHVLSLLKRLGKCKVICRTDVFDNYDGTNAEFIKMPS